MKFITAVFFVVAVTHATATNTPVKCREIKNNWFNGSVDGGECCNDPEGESPIKCAVFLKDEFELNDVNGNNPTPLVFEGGTLKMNSAVKIEGGATVDYILDTLVELSTAKDEDDARDADYINEISSNDEDIASNDIDIATNGASISSNSTMDGDLSTQAAAIKQNNVNTASTNIVIQGIAKGYTSTNTVISNNNDAQVSTNTAQSTADTNAYNEAKMNKEEIASNEELIIAQTGDRTGNTNDISSNDDEISSNAGENTRALADNVANAQNLTALVAAIINNQNTNNATGDYIDDNEASLEQLVQNITEQQNLTLCTSGHYRDLETLRCQPCATNTFISDDDLNTLNGLTCKPCPTGQYTDGQVGQSTCVAVPTPAPTASPTPPPTESPTGSPTGSPTESPTVSAPDYVKLPSGQTDCAETEITTIAYTRITNKDDCSKALEYLVSRDLASSATLGKSDTAGCTEKDASVYWNPADREPNTDEFTHVICRNVLVTSAPTPPPTESPTESPTLSIRRRRTHRRRRRRW